MKTMEAIATFSKDTRRKHRFDLNDNQSIVGVLYFDRGEEVPDEVRIILKTKADEKPSEGP